MMKNVSIGEVELSVAQQGSGRPLLLVHGFPLDHQMWDGQINELCQEFQVIAPDLRGFGQSECGRSTEVEMARYADDLACLLEKLAIDEPVILCGLSMGGYIAFEFWRRHRSRLSHLILCDTRAVPDTPEVAAGRLETAERVLREGPEFLVEGMVPKLFSRETQRHNHALIEATADVIKSSRPEGVAAALRGLARREDATPWLSEIELPTLVLCGQEDAVSSVAEMRGIADAIPDAEYAVVPDCGHMAPAEAPRRVSDVVRTFLGTPR
ncbi:MAG: alpha/beta fold hydrolase [Planctomycetota bacterium]